MCTDGKKLIQVLKALCDGDFNLDTSMDDAQRDPESSQEVNGKECLTNLKEIVVLSANLCETIRMREYSGQELEEVNQVLLSVRQHLQSFFYD